MSTGCIARPRIRTSKWRRHARCRTAGTKWRCASSAGPLAPIRGKMMPLGDSLLDATTRSGTLATIYLEPVESLARTAGVSTNTVMARVIAHELGHLLLGTNAHSAIGLMRPAWTADELVRDRPRDWMISADEGRQMQQELLRRSELDSAVA